MNAVLHRFPFSKLGSSEAPAMELETFDPASAADIGKVVQDVLGKSRVILDLLESDRDVVRRIGIESLCVEILAIIEGEKFQRVSDAISEAVSKNGPLTLTRDGLSRLRRLESLTAEAERTVGRFIPAEPRRRLAETKIEMEVLDELLALKPK